MQYHPGGVEAPWFEQPVNGKICKIASQESQIAGSVEWIRAVRRLRGENQRPLTTAQTGALSRFTGRDGCEEYIEPLTGIARDPFSANIGCKYRYTHTEDGKPVSKYETRYIIPMNLCRPANSSAPDLGSGCHAGTPGACRASTVGGGAAPCGRNLFYDLGCTVYGAPMPPGSIASSAGPSIQFFERMYERNCIVFDRIWAWEAIPYDAASWWRPVPLHVRTKLHFYNLPVNAKWDSDASALRTIHATARPEDFVVVKVDIDGSGPVELEIVKAIADNPDISRLVDEVYFEYHFYSADVSFGWRMQRTNASERATYTNDTVDDALALMQRLRARGVRSHFWV